MSRFFFLLICLMSLSAAVVAQKAPAYEDVSEMPGGVLGQRIEALINTINSDNPKLIKQFILEQTSAEFRDAFPMEEHIMVFRDLFRQTGGLTFHSIRRYTPARNDQTVVIAQNYYYKGWDGLILKLDARDKISSLEFAPARVPTNLDKTDESLSTKDNIYEVESLMERLCTKDVFSGAVLIGTADEIYYQYACGEASKGFHVPNTVQTKFNLGSMNKMFTSVAILQLVDKGLIAYDDKLSKYLDETWLPRSISDKITIHHLLTHTSGLGSYFNETFWKSSREMFRKLDDYKPLVQGEKLAFEPGEKYQYSNTGMLLLGVVIEKAMNTDYFEYIQESVYNPARMLNTDCYDLDQVVENLAEGYIPSASSPSGWENNTFKHVIKGGPAGGGYSTVQDLYYFAKVLLAGKWLNPKTQEKMWTDHSGAGYGYGFSVEATDYGTVVGHSGGFPGLNSNLDILLNNGYIIVVMSNYDQGAMRLSQRLRQMFQADDTGKSGKEGSADKSDGAVGGDNPGKGGNTTKTGSTSKGGKSGEKQ
ncbi:MAG TPA: serine hydrolase domain-containing protein [Saprospiraceae bacterium]|nr:serine hydrolase domain-containing protein [Saprospiraceae bacterium]HMQ81258.1 serine hydrolase domain-containing protein [Saprospiraceae bacterium]